MEAVISQQIKLGQRLACINNLITGQYQDIWDTCCDHGLLGYQLLQRNLANTVHFVDVVPELMQQLQVKLEQFAAKQSWQVHCLDIANLRLPDTGRQLIIIAGVGGDKTIELVQSIVEFHPNRPLEFMLCAVHHNFMLRQSLAALKLGLINEQIVCENKRYYEVIQVASNAPGKIVPTGDSMWDLGNKQHQQYLEQTINHYQRKAQSGEEKAANIAAEYKRLKR